MARLLLGLVASLAAVGHAASGQDSATSFGETRGILSNHCFRCHGPDAAAREADLRLDRRSEAVADRGGYQVIVAGDSAGSALIERITASDPDERMPPPESGLTLTTHQIEQLRRWIDQGAAYETHWSFLPIARTPVPRTSNADWIRHPIDAFVMRRLESANLSPSPRADRYTLIRRLYLDLLGLPPTLRATRAFVNDSAPDAYARLVDRLLGNSRYGERWGRHWLDQARYADTNGYTVDSERSIWPYRDWVIGAINADMPFDQFSIEQLAGDLLPGKDPSRLVATGFHRNTLVNQEGGTDDEQFRVEAASDRVDTTASVWLGLTAGCARCHNHKYDPLSHREYYQLFAFFNQSQDVNSIEPTTPVATPEQRGQLDRLANRIADANRRLQEYKARRMAALPVAERDDGQPVPWQIADVAHAESTAGSSFTRLADASWLVEGPHRASDEYRLVIKPPLPRIRAMRLEALTHPALPQGGPGRAESGNFVLSDVALATAGQSSRWIHATADHAEPNHDVTLAIDGDPSTGWSIGVPDGRLNIDRVAEFVLQDPLESGEELELRMRFVAGEGGASLGRFRIAFSSAPLGKFRLPDPERDSLRKEVEQARKDREAFASKIPTTMVMRDVEERRVTHRFERGDFLRKAEPVQPDVPDVLPNLNRSGDGADAPASRLDLARWLVSDEQPLTPRVVVNRVWMRFFGIGLVATENDFGIQGETPSHPELLDWLASEWVRQGWSLKWLHRQIVTSATYQQSSRTRPDLARADPANRLLGRQRRIRVEAEIVRDLALSVSGLLDNRIGGRSVYPPQPDGVYAFTQRNASWPTSKGADRYRRGLYTFFMRSAPYPMLTTFDTPRFNASCTRRIRSNTPLQALTMANDDAMMEMTRAFGRRLHELADGDSDRIEWAFQRCMTRPPSDSERALLLDYVRKQRSDFASDPAAAERFVDDNNQQDAVELATWTSVARLLMNLDEFVTRE